MTPSPLGGRSARAPISADLGYATSIRVARSLDTMPPAGLAAGRERLAFVAEVLVGYQVEVTVRFASRARTRARDPARSHLDRSASFSRPHGKES